MTKKSYSFEFPVTLVKQYLYCPRIPYLILFLGYKERTTELMKHGKEEHEKNLRKMKRKGWEVNVFLKSEKYGIYGYVDAVRKLPSGFEVYEIKYTEYRKKIVKSHVYQTACYALLVEENLGRVIRLIIEYRDRIVSYPFTRGVRNYAVSLINKIHSIHENGLVTTRIEKSRCLNCGYSRICKEF